MSMATRARNADALTESEFRYLRRRVRFRNGLRNTPPSYSDLGISLTRAWELNVLADTFLEP